jgi:glycerol kinase
MSDQLLLGIDEGTTAVKASLLDSKLRPVAQARRGVPLAHPREGWVEQDPELILRAVVEAVAEVLGQAHGREILAAGIDHQGESVLAWDAQDGRPLTQVLVWQDKRQQALLAGLDGERIEARSGLPLDPYFSAGKLAWLLENDTRVQAARERGALRMGTVECFLLERLGGRFATDLSTASRTQLLALGGSDWDGELLGAFGLERELLAPIGPSYGALGTLSHPAWPCALPLRAQLVDQQAALAGSGAVAAGELKATYGTGVFVLGRTDALVRAAGLLPTVAWAGPSGEVAYALDGGVFTAGSLLDWLARDLGLAPDTPALLAAAASVSDSAGVRVLPALAGLGAPWWRSQAQGVIAGLHAGVSSAHIARAALESIAWRVADVVEAMAAVVDVQSVRVDGGLSNDQTLLALQADALGMPVHAGAPDATALGAAMLAGVGAGVFASVEDAAQLLPQARVVRPSIGEGERARLRARWREFVEATSALTA